MFYYSAIIYFYIRYKSIQNHCGNFAGELICKDEITIRNINFNCQIKIDYNRNIKA